ncbi:hypothetical protein [uncultured Friedmanniella sp.]|uniref:hypothetical protein n=1 Tax=uncultured Friedmanniella sp. TaxID=335381 RepID=UPI0035CB133E
MTDDDPRLVSPLDATIRAAHRSLSALTPPGTLAAENSESLPVLVEDLENLVPLARDGVAGELGPVLRWVGPYREEDEWAPVFVEIDLDEYSEGDPPGAFYIDQWEGSPLAQAARAYRRDCGWDFTPDEAGVWLLFVAPYSAMGSGDQTPCAGNLVGFAILHDRDEDGVYESLAHLWTARAWRCRGVGADLVREARVRFPVTQVEGPFTYAGHSLFVEVAPDLVT